MPLKPAVPPALDAHVASPPLLSKQCIWSEIQEQACHVYFEPFAVGPILHSSEPRNCDDFGGLFSSRLQRSRQHGYGETKRI